MKIPASTLRRRSDVDMNSTMTPMIDVVFLLLVFFVWTASFQIVEQILISRMSSQTGADPVEQVEPTPQDDFDNVVVKISFDGDQPTWTVNQNPATSLDDVRTRLDAVFNVEPASRVVVDPDPVVPLGHVIDVYDASKKSGFQEISFAVNQ